MKTRLLKRLRREAENAYPIFPSVSYRGYMIIKRYRRNYIKTMISKLRDEKSIKKRLIWHED